ncbi:MAG: SpoIIE family protein phosphatase [Bacteroidetes bacterium]|nr:SpoIIE family protein phosphatase [Bacteroidota bacterium]
MLAIADSTGHGVPGAIMSLLNIISLEKTEHYTNPADILNNTCQTIIKLFQKRDGSLDGGKDGMDCSLFSFDFANNKLQISAANNPVWIMRRNSFNENNVDESTFNV